MLAAPAWVVLLVACGSGDPAQPPPTPITGAPAGNYTLTVTATSGSITRSATVALTVE